MILTFAVTNFRSFAETARLDLTTPELRTITPRAGKTWSDVTDRVAAIYGANAAGKSTVLDAINALAHSLRTPGSGRIHQPHAATAKANPCTEYEVEFVADSTRYAYKVCASTWGIAREELRSYPKGTSRLLFRRTMGSEQGTTNFAPGASLTGPSAEVWRITKPTMLYLATAHRFGHPQLAPIARALLAGVGIDHLSFRERQDEDVLRRVVMEMVAAPDAQVDLVKALVQAADLGVESMQVRSQEIPQEVRARIERVLRAMEDGDDQGEVDVPSLQEEVVFRHHCKDGKSFELPVHRESSGTITWLSMAWHALDSLRNGTVLLVDELDASLHPVLARQVVELFLDPSLNTKGAQLVFSSHDVTLLGNSPTRLLEPRQVWFAQKGRYGESELFSQDMFDNRRGNNSERRYLAGAFGALPNIDDRLLQDYLALPSSTPETIIG